MKKIISAILISALLCVPVSAEEGKGAIIEPEVNAQGAILIEYDTQRVLWEKNADEPLANASTTKIMTAILAIEKCGLDEVITASKNAAATPPTKMYLTEGEEQRLEDLLYALMLESANDAAVAIAEHIGGSVEGFCEMMTKRAAELGATNTVFKTPNGLDLEDHHSTARDLALITRHALSNSDFLRIVGTQSVTTPVNGGDFKQHSFTNKDRLLYEYDGALGVKTGYTGKAGHCFVGAAKKDGMMLISVVLASGWGQTGKEQKWTDTKTLLNFGFDNFEYVKLADKGHQISQVDVLHSKNRTVGLRLSEGLALPLTKAEKEKVSSKMSVPDILDAPVSLNEELGYVEYYVDGKSLAKIKIIADGTVERHDFKISMGKILDTWLRLEIDDLLRIL